MYAVILKEGTEYVIIDAYYKGRWRCDSETIKCYLAYMSGFDQLSPRAVDGTVIVRNGELMGLPAKLVEQMVHQFEQEHMPRYGNFDPMYLAQKIDHFDDGIITPPNSIIEVTPYCNYNCDWCYIPPRSKIRNESYSIEELRNNVVVPLMREFGATEWCLTGGEPTIDPLRTIELARMIQRESFTHLGKSPTRMYMLTTGYQIAKYIDDFQDAGINSYQVSLSSPSSERENKLRRSPKNVDSYTAALSAIDAIVGRGMRAEINMIIQPMGAHSVDNLYDIPEMIHLAREHQVKMLRVIPAVPCGQAKENSVLMTPFEYAEVARMVSEGRASAPDLIIDCPIDQRIEKDRSMFCRAGTLWLYFDYRGNIYPCNNLQEPENRVWSSTIRTDSAAKVWRESPLLNYMRDYRQSSVAEACQECGLRVACAGECRAMTWARYRKYDLAEKPHNCFADQHRSTTLLPLTQSTKR